MSMPTWKLNKKLDFGYYDAYFYTLYEDARDIMCDSYRPEWVVARYTDKNRMVELRDGFRNETVWSRRVTKDEGNELYREMVRHRDRLGFPCSLQWQDDAWIAEHPGDRD